MIVQGKVVLSFLQGFVRGILCNWLVCLAIFLAMPAENPVEKNFLVAGTFEGGGPGITWGKALLRNLLPVTLGNIVGGSILVGMLYHLMSTKGGELEDLFH